MNPITIQQLLDWWNNMPQSEKAECDALSVISEARRLAAEEAKKSTDIFKRKAKTMGVAYKYTTTEGEHILLDPKRLEIFTREEVKDKPMAPASLVEELVEYVAEIHDEALPDGDSGKAGTEAKRYIRDKILAIFSRYRPAPQTAGGEGLNSQWPMKDILAKLAEAAGILLDGYNYDGHGYEQIRHAQKSAQEIVKRLAPNPAKPVEPKEEI